MNFKEISIQTKNALKNFNAVNSKRLYETLMNLANNDFKMLKGAL